MIPKSRLRKELQMKQQSGAALIVGLVLMLVLTVLAISTMRTATLELAMAGNSQYRQKAEQLAAAGIADILDRADRGLLAPPDPLVQGAIIDDTGVVPVTEQGTGEQIGTYRATVAWIASPPSPEWGGIVLDDVYTIISTGQSARNAQSIQTQGFKIRRRIN